MNIHLLIKAQDVIPATNYIKYIGDSNDRNRG